MARRPSDEEDPQANGAAPMRTRLLSARLLALLLSLRTSSAIAYRNRTGFIEQQRRMITLVGNFDGLTSVELVALTGLEKAQVSRTLAALVEAGLVERARLRARIQLSDAGKAAFEQIMTVAHARNRDLTRGLTKAEIARFAAATRQLTERAKLLLAHEREISTELEQGSWGRSADLAPMPDRLMAHDPAQPLGLMIAPPLITLVAYLQRSATISFRRETGLSNFEWQVMSQIGEYAPVPLLRLIELLGRDKSQVGRTVRRLEEQGLVVRAAAAGRMVTLDVTPKGQEVYGEMCRVAIGRDDFLLGELPAEERAAYIDVVERLTANAERLLSEERAADA